MHKFLFYNKFIIWLYMFRALCAHHQEVKIVLYSIWYHHTETSEWSKITKTQILTFCWPCISVYLSHYLTNLMHKFCFTIRFISCLYMFRVRVLIIRRSKLQYTVSGICILVFISLFNQLYAQNLFHNKFYFMPLHISSTCDRNM